MEIIITGGNGQLETVFHKLTSTVEIFVQNTLLGMRV